MSLGKMMLFLCWTTYVIMATLAITDQSNDTSDTYAPAIEIIEEPKEPAAPVSEVKGRYEDIIITEHEREILARCVFLEAGCESPEGQQAVVEVILNRVLADNFPNTVEEVIYQYTGFWQFSTAPYIETASAGDKQYQAIDAAFGDINILPLDVVFFSVGGAHARVWGEIGNHVFCYQYQWS